MKKLFLVVLAASFLFVQSSSATDVRDDMNYTGSVTMGTMSATTGTITTLNSTTGTIGSLTVSSGIDLDGLSIGNILIESETVAATNVITAAECGKDFYLSHATEFASTLPALSTVSAGCRMRFIVAAAPVGADYTVVTGNSLENQIFGQVVVNNATVAGADEDTITFAASAALKGDWAEVVSDGTSWYVSGLGVGAGAITLTAAD